MVERSKDWLDQANRDFAQAKASLRDGFYEWARFAAQQGAEKAVKGLIQNRGGESWVHSVGGLIDALPEEVRPVDLREKALDQAYIPSRYPNAHPASFPGKNLTKTMAERLIHHSEEIVAYCMTQAERVKDVSESSGGHASEVLR